MVEKTKLEVVEMWLLIFTCLLISAVLIASIVAGLIFGFALKLYQTTKSIEGKVRAASKELSHCEFPNDLLNEIAETIGFNLADAKKGLDDIKTMSRTTYQVQVRTANLITPEAENSLDLEP